MASSETLKLQSVQDNCRFPLIYSTKQNFNTLFLFCVNLTGPQCFICTGMYAFFWYKDT